MREKYISWIAWSTLVFSIIYFFVVPLTGDAFVFISHAYITESKFGGGILNAARAWELKPIFNRVFFYILYHLSTMIVGDGDLLNLHIALKFFYLVFILGAAWGVVQVLEKSRKGKLIASHRFLLFSLSCAVLMLLPLADFFQCEYNAVIFCLIAAGILAHGQYRHKVILCALSLLVIATGFKVLTVAIVFQTCILLVLVGECPWRRALLIFFSTIVAFILFIFLLYFVFPQEIYNFMLAPTLQKSNSVSVGAYLKIFRNVIRFFFHFRSGFGMVYVMPFIFLSVAIIIVDFFSNFKVYRTTLTIISLLSGIIAIVIQLHCFYYHYVFILIPIITGLCSVMYLQWSWKIILGAAFFLIFPLIGLLLLNTPLQKWGPWPEKDVYHSWHSITEYDEQQEIKQIIPTNNNRKYTAFYFDDGTGVYLFRYQSACRFFYPLPLIRDASGMPEYQECLLALKSEPDFIVVQHTFLKKMSFFYPDYLKYYELAYKTQKHIVFKHKRLSRVD